MTAEDWDVTLLIGRGSDTEHLFTYYNIPYCERLHIDPLFIVRKNNPLGISWNFPFFFLCQRSIQRARPDAVILSVRKQGAYHLRHKVPGVRYVYEVHELTFYPNAPDQHLLEAQEERDMLKQADLVTVTTDALKVILEAPPYSLKNRIEVVPLAVQATALPPPASTEKLQLAYVGQLYAGQGVTILLKALSKTQNVHLKILGGRPAEITHLKEFARTLGIGDSVTFLGFTPPYEIPQAIQDVHAFVAPFENTGRMPYVAHTKLFEYAHWGRPIIAPDLPIVREHFHTGNGVLLFKPGDPVALASCIQQLQQEPTRIKLQNGISTNSGRFSWAARAKKYARLLS